MRSDNDDDDDDDYGDDDDDDYNILSEDSSPWPFASRAMYVAKSLP